MTLVAYLHEILWSVLRSGSMGFQSHTPYKGANYVCRIQIDPPTMPSPQIVFSCNMTLYYRDTPIYVVPMYMYTAAAAAVA